MENQGWMAGGGGMGGRGGKVPQIKEKCVQNVCTLGNCTLFGVARMKPEM